MIEVSALIALVGCALSVATFYIGRQSGAKAEGKEAGSVSTDLKYIKDSVERIETRLNDDVRRLEGRIDELSSQLNATTGTSSRAHESARSAHNRVDEHLKREHGAKIVRRDD